MSKKVILKMLLLAGWSGAAGRVDADEVVQPNILLILADDAGYHDFGFQGDPLYQQATPHIDNLARDGARFTQAYVSGNVCAPSRAGLITGRYQQRVGFRDNFPQHWNKEPDGRWKTDAWKNFGLDPQSTGMADYLKSSGYSCGMVGKWHLGYADRFLPREFGFDFFYGLRGGSRSFFPEQKVDRSLPPNRYKQLETNEGFLPEDKIQHITQTFGDAAIEFLEDARDPSKPFFLYLSFTAPHTPLQPDAESLAEATRLFPDATKDRQAYMGLIIGMDRQVGRVMECLQENGLDENTLVIFLSDNGGSSKNASNNDPLRGHKWSPFEGGYRVPMALKWPGIVEPGSVISEPLISLDLLPSFVSIAGGKIPADLDGQDFSPVLMGGTLEERTFFWRDSNSEGLTTVAVQHPWKLILREETKWRKLKESDPWLFNLEDDLAETTNRAKEYPDVVKKLRAQLDAWKKTLPAPRW